MLPLASKVPHSNVFIGLFCTFNCFQAVVPDTMFVETATLKLEYRISLKDTKWKNNSDTIRIVLVAVFSVNVF